MCDSSEDSSGAVSSLLCLTRKIITNPELSPGAPVMSSTMKEEISDGSSKGSEGVVSSAKQNQVGSVMLFGVPIVSLVMDGKERLCLAQISSTLLKDFSYNEIHNRRVALGINCVQCTPVQLEILRRAGAMPVTSRRCGMITRREAERLCKSFLGDHAPPQLPENFAFDVYHECGWGCRGSFVPSRYNSSRAKCIRCSFCQLFFSPNKFIFHSHRLPESRYVQPDAANFNSWRRHMKLCGDPPEEANSSNSISDLATAQIVHAWEDVKAMFNGGTRKRLLAASVAPSSKSTRHSSSAPTSHGHGSGGGVGHGHTSSSSSSSPSKNVSSKAHHGENHPNPGGGNAHARSQSKKEAGSTSGSGSVSSSTAVPTQQPHPPSAGYNPDAGFLHQSPQHPFLNVNVANPLLSPGGRLDTIWNPALQGSRPCQMPGSSPFSSLPFHPLSIPWLRRPLFPFSHPFGPTLVNDTGSMEGGASPTEKLASLAAVARQNQSAFKPVSRSVEPLFNWLNGNGFAGLPHPPPTLPEDLSLHSGGNATPGGANLSAAGVSPHFTNNNNLVPSYQARSGPTTEKSHQSNRTHNNNNKQHQQQQHQIQILTSPQAESDDEENVDIESTVETEECSSTSSVWVSSTTLHNINNNTIRLNSSSRSRKRSLAPPPSSPPPCYSSGEDEMDAEREEEDCSSQSDNQDDYTHLDSKISSQSSPSPRESKPGSGSGGKRKRLWVNEIISTTDEDEEGGRHQHVMLVNSVAKKSEKVQKSQNQSHHHHHHNSSSRLLLDSRE